MKRFVEGEDRTQITLLPECLDDYVGEDNRIRVVEVFVDELDLGGLGFEGVDPAATGRPAYHPSVLLKIYIYGYLNRLQSSRRLEREAQRNVELMWLTQRLTPDFKTIADFRRDNGRAIRNACRQFVVVRRKLDLFSQSIVAIDGSKFKAVNNRDRNFTDAKIKRRIEQIEQSIERYLAAMDTADRTQSEVAEPKAVRLKDKIEKLKPQMQGNSPTNTRLPRLRGSDVDEVTKQFEANSPLLAITPERGGALVDAHDQADAMLQVLVGEGHPVSDAEVGAAWDLWWRARSGEFHVCRCRTAIDKVLKGKGRVVNARFAVMCAHYLYDPDFCNVASGWEKGVVEKNVQDSRRRVWIDAQQMRFGSIDELNAWVGERCRQLWTEVKHPEHKQFSVAEMLEHERLQMMPMPAAFDGYVEEVARVSSTCLVTVARNRYSVPCELAGQMLSTRLYPTRVMVVADDVIVADHQRLMDKGKIRYDWRHYVPLLERKPGALRNGAPFADLPEPLQRMRRALLRETGGDRVMAKILALVPGAGLDAVLVAVELALEGTPPSGRVSIEHVINVLARLNAPARPANVATTLQILTPPIADPGRYDRLRDIQGVDHDA